MKYEKKVLNTKSHMRNGFHYVNGCQVQVHEGNTSVPWDHNATKALKMAEDLRHYSKRNSQ